MAWENTLLASRVLPPSYVPVDSSANANRTMDASMVLDQDGRLTLLIILTTAAGLAIVLLFFLLLRIGCMRKKSCCWMWRFKDRDIVKRAGSSSGGDRSSSYLASVATSNNANERRCSAKSSAAASQETLQTRSEHDKTSNYTIKLIDNDLIIETQQQQHQEGVSGRALGLGADLPFADASAVSVSPAGEPVSASGSQLFKSWLLTLKNKEWDNQSFQMANLETKSLCGSPGHHSRRLPERHHEWLANEKQEILARFGQHLPGFGFTRSGSSIDASWNPLYYENRSESVQSISSTTVQQHRQHEYSYSYGNQTEYMGGRYGYVDPVFGHHFRSITSAGTDGGGRTSVRADNIALNRARSAESLLVVIANPIPYPIVSYQP